MKFIKQFIRTYRSLILSSAICIFSVISGLFVLYPLGKTTYHLFSEAQTLSSDIEEARKKLSLLESLDTQTLERQLVGLTDAVPIDKFPATLINTVEQVGQNNGVSIHTFSLSSLGSLETPSASQQTAQEKKLGSSILTAHIDVSGTYESIKNFLRELVSVRRSLRITTFSLNVKGDFTSSQLNIDGFYAPLPKTGTSQPILTPLTAEEEETLSRLSSIPNFVQAESAKVVTFDPNRNPFSQ